MIKSVFHHFLFSLQQNFFPRKYQSGDQMQFHRFVFRICYFLPICTIHILDSLLYAHNAIHYALEPTESRNIVTFLHPFIGRNIEKDTENRPCREVQFHSSLFTQMEIAEHKIPITNDAHQTNTSLC